MNLDYWQIKYVHMALAAISVSGFILRWSWQARGSAMSGHRLSRTLPHMVDTLFLASGVWLAITISQYPFTHDWLTAKLGGLVTYILLGMVAMSGKLPHRAKTIAFACALLVFAWIVSIACFKSAWGFLSLLEIF